MVSCVLPARAFGMRCTRRVRPGRESSRDRRGCSSKATQSLRGPVPRVSRDPHHPPVCTANANGLSARVLDARPLLRLECVRAFSRRRQPWRRGGLLHRRRRREGLRRRTGSGGMEVDAERRRGFDLCPERGAAGEKHGSGSALLARGTRVSRSRSWGCRNASSTSMHSLARTWCDTVQSCRSCCAEIVQTEATAGRLARGTRDSESGLGCVPSASGERRHLHGDGELTRRIHACALGTDVGRSVGAF
ncbi:hypothetical protein C8T65DRAFT_686726 [Cerioporus squamosus]|nr:hypothetical protein C8T65DRAFT_686726 [Cerioporus squamosus]